MSMMIMAYMLKPWLSLVRSCGAAPMVLADDMMITTKGDQGAGRLAEAMEATAEMLKDMSAKQKCGQVHADVK